MPIPQEPGLYWASTAIRGEFDSIVRVYSKSPFLKYEMIPLHVSQLGKSIDPRRRNNPIIGPRLDIPTEESDV